jgi:hypothetical protein
VYLFQINYTDRWEAMLMSRKRRKLIKDPLTICSAVGRNRINRSV